MGWCEEASLTLTLTPTPTLTLMESSRRHPTGRERMVSPTLQRHQDPILLLPWLFEVADQSLTLAIYPGALLVSLLALVGCW